MCDVGIVTYLISDGVTPKCPNGTIHDALHQFMAPPIHAKQFMCVSTQRGNHYETLNRQTYQNVRAR